MDRGAAVVEDLVYDVGMHKGEDTAYYLAKGYRVVGFEADPDRLRECRSRFEAEIAAGRCTIVEGAIADSDGPSIRFFKHPEVTAWGTIRPARAERNAIVAESVPIAVPVVDFAACLRRTGVPAFMKVDIEGAGNLCLETLLQFDARPEFLSIESDQEHFQAVAAEFDLLERLGYDRFAVVQQAGIHEQSITTSTVDGRQLTYRFERGASGAFGDDVAPWLSREEALERYRRIFRAYRLFGPSGLVRRTWLGRGLRKRAARLSGRPLPGWHDTHARRS
jgi:FkbM family methyltransferase